MAPRLTTRFFVVAPEGAMKHSGKGWRLLALAAAVAIPVIIGAQAQPLPEGAAAGQQAAISQGKGGKPGGGGGTSMGPTTLGAPADMGCRWTKAYGINAAAVPMVVGIAGGCENPHNKPFIWSAPTGAATGNSTGIWARAVSDDGIVVGMAAGQEPVIFDDNGGVATILARPFGYTTGEATNITSDGTAIVGYVYSVAENGNHPFLWQRTSSGDWGEGEPIPSNGGWAWGVTRVGDEIRVVGAAAYGAWHGAVLWSHTSFGWTLVQLDADSDANAIDATATVIAGTRTLPLPSDPTRTYNVHVVWVDHGADGWQVATLKGADSSFDEGEALGIADQPDGSTVVVGYSWQDTSGAGGTPWAVAWTRAAGATAFGSPKLLPPLSKRWGATASGVNSRGEVVGTGSTGIGSNAVMWKLR